MNSKNIKKVLNSKLEQWMSNVDDEEIKKIIKNNTIITGGAIVSLLTNEEVNDYDIYFRTKDSLYQVADYYVKKFNAAHPKSSAYVNDEDGRITVFIQSTGIECEDGDTGISDETEPVTPKSSQEIDEHEIKPKYRPTYLTSNAISLSDKIQIVIRFYGEPEEIHRNYDFAHCTCVWTSWDNSLVLPTKALECIINKELYYVGSRYPLCSIIRSRKFINRGWSINAGQYLKMCLQLNEFDLHKIDVLKDQLTGVDSAYFEQVIQAMKTKKENEPDFEPDNNYLFEIINKIF